MSARYKVGQIRTVVRICEWCVHIDRLDQFFEFVMFFHGVMVDGTPSIFAPGAPPLFYGSLVNIR